ncbi:SGNH/GDSL hydrolase family protein [Moraxella marmotae]|uniref:SGNH/GDSL hydrolase family protein n=1 Tax=Moraxella marmotae TaxID=3344520 RepID=UPI0035F3E5B3
MQTSNQPSANQHQKTHYPEPKHIKLGARPTPYFHGRTYAYLLGVLIAFAIACTWIMQNSINAYYLQTYHKDSPLSKFEQSTLWKKGGDIGNALYQMHGSFTDSVVAANQWVVDFFNEYLAYTPEYKAELAQKFAQEAARQAAIAEENRQKQLASQYTLRTGDEIFFAGDSMMQGVAPHVQQYLQKNYNIKSVNLSKQSTGLAYPSLFNWPKTIEETLSSNANIKILAVFLGPNDPWDMPDLVNGGQLKFQTPEWEAGYRARMATILDSAKNHGVKVIWITPPNMKKQKLNEQMIYLNGIMQDELKRHGALVIDSRQLLGTSNDVYNDYLVKDGESIKMRSGDGIHFSVKGQKLIAEALQEQLTIVP